MEINNLNKYIDHTLLKPDAKESDITILINEAIKYDFMSVCINPCYVNFAAQKLKNTDVKVCTVIGFPLGANSTKTKVYETVQAISDGAQEIDMVINISALKSNKHDLVLQEIKEIRKVCTSGVILKVIIETGLLTREEKITACKLVSEAKADFIKTSTGFANSGATIEDVILMKENISDSVLIKASGGVKNKEQAINMIKAGAARIGTSNGVVIVNNGEAKSSY